MIPFSLELLGAFGLAISTPGSNCAPEVQANAAIVAAARSLSSSHSGHVEHFSLGFSRIGREVVGLRLGTSKQVASPAILLVAGLDGARAYTSSMALDHATQLAQGYGSNDAITELLDTTTIYIIPRLDADACEARFLAPLAEHSASGFGIDNDRDGRMGEDGPSDVNLDGYITWMRQLDPEGTWIEDPTDARAMIEADTKKGERGKWKLLGEGLDSDNDEEVGEDPLVDAVLNRNFPRNWTEHNAAAGRYPTDEPTALAMIEFLLDHRDIALVLTYGDEGNLVKKPASQKDSGASGGSVKTGVYEKDLDFYEEIGSRYREITSTKTEGLEEQPGSFQGFVYHHRGLICLNIDPWSIPLDSKMDAAEDAEQGEGADKEGEEGEEKKSDEAKPSDDAKRLIWLDLNKDNGFLPWTKFDHPQLGQLDIGGFLPYAKVEPPTEQLAKLSQKHFEFLLTLGAYLPRVELVEVEGTDLGGGLVEITATLENAAFFPQHTRAAERSRTIRPARVGLALPKDAEIVAGSAQTLVSSLRGSGGRKDLRWLVSGLNEGSEIYINVNTDNAGTASAKVEVK